MLFRFFRSSFLVQYSVIVITAGVLWLPAFLQPVPAGSPAGFSPLYELLFAWIQSYPLISTSLAFLLLIFQAFYFNAILAHNLMIGRVSTVAAFMYVIMFSLHPALTVLQPLMVAMPLVLVSFKLLLEAYDTPSNELKLFNISLLISLSGLIFFPLSLLIIWVFLALFVFRISNLREWLVPFIGFITPYVYLFSVYFFQDRLITKIQAYSELPSMLVFPPAFPDLQTFITLLLVAVVFLRALGTNYSSLADRNIALRKKKASVNILIIIGLSFMFVRNGNSFDYALGVMPVAVHLSIWANTIRKYFWPHIFVLALILVSFINNYLLLFR